MITLDQREGFALTINRPVKRTHPSRRRKAYSNITNGKVETSHSKKTKYLTTLDTIKKTNNLTLIDKNKLLIQLLLKC